MIRIEGVRFAYPGGRELLSECDLAVAPGEVLALAGPNGAGKTTLLKLVAGLLVPAVGAVTLQGRAVASWERVSRAKRLAYVPQKPVVPEDWPVSELVALGDYPHQEAPPAPRPLSARLAAARRAMELEDIWDRSAGTLSGGEAQRVALARALVQEAPALVLDEPCSHLDLRHQMGFYALLADLARGGAAVLLSTHDLNMSRLYGQRVALMDARGAVRPFPSDGESQGPALKEVFGVSFLPQEVSGVVCWFPRKDGVGEVG